MLLKTYSYFALTFLMLLPTIMASTNFKYAKEIATHIKNPPPCPKEDYEEMEKDAFRWTFSDIKDPRNFLPRALLVEDDEQKKRLMKKCNGWSLSLFETEEQAIRKLKKICSEEKTYLYLKLGTHVAKGIIGKEDGKCGDIDTESGHFEHFEYEGIDLASKFQIVQKIYDGE